MKYIPSKFKHIVKEFVYQFFVLILMFMFFTYQHAESEYITIRDVVGLNKLSFFFNYMLAAYTINYVLLVKFYYKKKEAWFFFLVGVLIALVILVDEFILEQIFYPDTRGLYFPGLFFTLSETLPIMIITMAFKFGWDFYEKQKEIEDLKFLVKESELQFLKSQINPHFLFNNLNNIYSYALEGSTKTASIILELSSVLRYMLYDCTDDFVSLSKELSHLKHFTALNELQIESRGIISYTEDIQNGNFKIVPLILVVFIENAFKHSSCSQSENIIITINVSVSDIGLLEFKCSNTYINGYNNEIFTKGLGLQNVKKRLELIYHGNYNLEVKDTGELYDVNLKMRLYNE